MILVGATAVGIGSAVHSASRGMTCSSEVTTGMAGYMRRHGYARLEDFRGKRWRTVEFSMLPRTVRISDIVEETRTIKTFVLDDKMDARRGNL